MDGCASLLDVANTYYLADCANRSGVIETRRVPTVSFTRVLERWLGGRDVAFAKIGERFPSPPPPKQCYGN